MRSGIFYRGAAVAALLLAQACAAPPPREPSSLVRQVLEVNTPNYTGGLTRADRALADQIHKSLETRYYATCDQFNIFQGELVGFGRRNDVPLPSLAKVDPDLVLLIRALDNERQEVRDVAAYTLGLLGPSAKDAIPFLMAKFDAQDRIKGGWFGVGLQGVWCQPVSGLDYINTIPSAALDIVSMPPYGGDTGLLLLALYLNPDVEYPPGTLSGYFGNLTYSNRQKKAQISVVTHNGLQRLLDAPELSVQKRIEAVQTLNALENDSADFLPSSLRLADSSHDALRYHVGNALIRRHHERAIPLLIERITDKDWAAAWKRDLCDFGPPARAAETRLLEVAQRTDWPKVRHETLDALACVGTERSVPVLLGMLEGNDWESTEIAAKSLGKIGIRSQKVLDAIISLSENHWSAAVRKTAQDALIALGARPAPPPPPPSPPSDPDALRSITIGGGNGPVDHGLPWCDGTGRYSLDGKTWFAVKWILPRLEPVPRGFPRKNVFIQTVGTQSFMRVDDGWFFGSDGFEGEGTFVHVSDRGTITEWEGGTGVPFGHATIVRSREKIYAYGYEILKAGDAGTLFEITKRPDGEWTTKLVLILPSAPGAHAVAPSGDLLLSDGPNSYAVVDNRIVPLKCEKLRPGSYFDKN